MIEDIVTEQGISLTEIANSIGVSNSYFSAMKKNKFNPSEVVLEKLKKFHYLPSCKVGDLKRNQEFEKNNGIIEDHTGIMCD